MTLRSLVLTNLSTMGVILAAMAVVAMLETLAPLHPRGTRPPFVYVHGDFMAGGFHSHALARQLGPDQPVYVVHPHGLADRSIPTTIEAMAVCCRSLVSWIQVLAGFGNKPIVVCDRGCSIERMKSQVREVSVE